MKIFSLPKSIHIVLIRNILCTIVRWFNFKNMKSVKISDLLTTLGGNLHTIRNARKETLQSVAIDIGITHPIISKIENGRYKNLQITLLVKLCNHYNVSLQQVFSLEVANIFQFTQHNKGGSQKLIGQEVSSGYDLYIQQLHNENKYLKNQLQQFMDKVGIVK